MSDSSTMDSEPPARGLAELLMSLPDELLLEVAFCLPTEDLLRLSLTAKHLGSIAQEALYHSICIPYKTISYDPNYGRVPPSRIALLALTLARRQDLAHKIVELDLQPHIQQVQVDPQLFNSTTDPAPLWHKLLDLRMTESQVAGYLLRQVVNLRRLALSIHRDAYMGPYIPVSLGDQAFENLFGRLEHTSDMFEVAGLRNLRTLSIDSGTLEWPWCCLPRLKYLSLSHCCRLIGIHDYPQEVCNVQGLVIASETSILKAYPTWHKEIRPILRRFPHLKKLALKLVNDRCDDSGILLAPYVSAGNRGHFDTLIDKILPVQTTLEQLTITCDRFQDPEFLDFVAPSTHLARFVRLKVLDVDYEFLQHPTDDSRPQVTKMLPSSLEVLCIRRPRSEIFNLFYELVRCKSLFPRLNLIELYPRNDRGDNYEFFHYGNHNIWGTMAYAGIEASIYWHEDDYCKDWDDEDYDPFVCEIVAFLNGLKSEE